MFTVPEKYSKILFQYNDFSVAAASGFSTAGDEAASDDDEVASDGDEAAPGDDEVAAEDDSSSDI